jgi:glycine cleavage system H lipoate-binding protein
VLQVSWIRRKDYHLLTVGLTTYTGDERYQAIHAQHSEVGVTSRQETGHNSFHSNPFHFSVNNSPVLSLDTK